MTCDTLNSIYVQECTGCGENYIGETNNLRLRTNLRKTMCRKTGHIVSTHIYECTKNLLNDPKFKIIPLLKLNEEDNYRRNKESHFILKFKPSLNALL